MEAELELLTQEEAEKKPAGRAREDPQALEKPKYDTVFNLDITSPLISHVTIINMEVKLAFSASYLFELTCFCSRPDSTFTWFMNPFKSLKYLLWNNYKMCLIKFLVIGLLVALMGLFFYSMPVRALLKYDHRKIRSPFFHSARTLVGDNCLGFASLHLSD